MVSDYKINTQKAVQKLLQYWDQILFIGIISYLILIARNYEGPPSQFPMLFLIGGLVFIFVEFIFNFIGGNWRRYYNKLTQGVASEMDESLSDETFEKIEGTMAENENHSGDDVNSNNGLFRVILGTSVIGLFIISSYLIGFIYSIPIYIFLHFLILDSRDWSIAIITTVVVVILIYFLFGYIISVPIEEGVLTE